MPKIDWSQQINFVNILNTLTLSCFWNSLFRFEVYTHKKLSSNNHLQTSKYKKYFLFKFGNKIRTKEVKPTLTIYELLGIEPDRHYPERNE